MRGEPLHDDTPLLEAGADPRRADLVLLLLHGRGGSAQDILQLGSALAPPDLEIAALAPQARQHSWYPQSFLAPREHNQPWLDSALQRVERELAHLLAQGVPSERIVLAGFSQGACLASEAAARSPRRYGALLLFTGGLIGPEVEDGRYRGDFAGTPALLSSGDPDPHVPWPRVEATAATLARLGARVETRRWPGRPHTVSPDEIAIARQLLRDLATPVGASS